MRLSNVVGPWCWVLLAGACASTRVPVEPSHASPGTEPAGAGATASAPREPVPALASQPVSPQAERFVPIVESAGRSAADRELDRGRRPAELLAFAGVHPGMRVAELAAGAGYTAELLARAVGEHGVVYGHNPPFVLERFAEGPWSERLTRPVMRNVVRLDRAFDDPFPPEVRGLDLVVMVLFYHDTVWQGVDRARMNQAVFEALRPNGVFVVIDHSARPGSGIEDVQTLHRIDEQLVREEIARAGFRLAGESDFLRNPGDRRDWNAAPSAAGARRGTSDRFALKFVKP